MTLIFRNWQQFGTSQNGIEDKQSGTEGVEKQQTVQFLTRPLIFIIDS